MSPVPGQTIAIILRQGSVDKDSRDREPQTIAEAVFRVNKYLGEFKTYILNLNTFRRSLAGKRSSTHRPPSSELDSWKASRELICCHCLLWCIGVVHSDITINYLMQNTRDVSAQNEGGSLKETDRSKWRKYQMKTFVSPISRKLYLSEGFFDREPMPFRLLTGKVVQDICPSCEFGAIRPYTPSVNAFELIQSAFSSFDICEVSVLNDIANLEQELQQIESLLKRIEDRREKVAKDLDCCKALIAPIRECLPFLEKYISLSRNMPIHLSLNEVLDDDVLKVIGDVIVHSDRWLTLALRAGGLQLLEFLSLPSSPDILLRELNIFMYDARPLDINPAMLAKLFSSSPITELGLEGIPYSSMSIDVDKLRKLRVHSYDPVEIYSILQHAHNLLELAITPSVPPNDFAVNRSPTDYPLVRHASLQMLSVAVTLSDGEGITALPEIFNCVYLPALYQFALSVKEDQLLLAHRLETCTPIECSSLIDLFRRSQCTIFFLTFSVPISAENLLIPILTQSTYLRDLDIFVNAGIAMDVFRALSREQGMVPYLTGLRIRESPSGRQKVVCWKRTDGGGHLKMLRLALELSWDNELLLPVAPSSLFHDLFRMKENGMNIELLLNGKDCLIDGGARVSLFYFSTTTSWDREYALPAIQTVHDLCEKRRRSRRHWSLERVRIQMNVGDAYWSASPFLCEKDLMRAKDDGDLLARLSIATNGCQLSLQFGCLVVSGQCIPNQQVRRGEECC
ncbi:hypothetical protein EDD85DRAFT_784151 [Armillaria nabsnona]|nr:hypothetical protein EDD85DRAFT_784151 [Armillaria nabsnona]